MKNKKKYFTWIKLAIVIYCIVGIGLYYLQEKLLFHPVPLSVTNEYKFSQPFIEKNIELDKQTSYNLIQFTIPDSLKKGIVLYFHGNRENINHYAEFARNFTRNHFEVWMVDYPGFGKSTGLLTEQGLYDEALQVYKLARTKYTPSQIILYGKSIGTGIAAQLASVRDCKKVILETPYYSLTSLTGILFWMYPVNLMLKFKFPIHEYLPKINAPLTIFHGTSDGVIPYRNVKRLVPLLKSKDAFISIEGGSHNNLNSFSKMQNKLDSLLTR